jgi:hypothetical protein
MDADAIPGSESRSLRSQYWRLGTGGGVAPGPSPATLKGSRTFGVAAGGCPALPSGEGGVRAGAGRFLARLPGGWQG